MKTMNLLNIILGLLTILALYSCTNPSGEPPLWSNYYILVDENGLDFFGDNPEYDLSKLRVCFEFPGNCTEVSARDDLKMMYTFFNSSYVFEFPVFFTHPYLIDFGNGDIDTLSWEWSPAQSDYENAYHKLTSYSHIYNGEIVEKWEFQNRQEVNDWINGNISILRNSIEEFEKMRVVKIVKKRNPIESD